MPIEKITGLLVLMDMSDVDPSGDVTMQIQVLDDGPKQSTCYKINVPRGLGDGIAEHWNTDVVVQVQEFEDQYVLMTIDSWYEDEDEDDLPEGTREALRDNELQRASDELASVQERLASLREAADVAEQATLIRDVLVSETIPHLERRERVLLADRDGVDPGSLLLFESGH